jgi:hypothetical protein
MLDSFPAKAKEYRISRNPKLYQNPDVKRATAIPGEAENALKLGVKGKGRS